MPQRFFDCRKPLIALLIFVAPALCAADANAIEQTISAKTQAMIAERFGKHELIEGSKPLFKIQNNMKLSDSEVVIEGKLVRVRILSEKGAESYGVYADGNKDPFVSELIPGSSLSGNYFEVSVMLDESCGGKYKIVVVEKRGASLRMSNRNLRTYIADCHGQ